MLRLVWHKFYKEKGIENFTSLSAYMKIRRVNADELFFA